MVFFLLLSPNNYQKWNFIFVKAIEGVPKIREGYNPATWMLEITSPAQEAALGVNFTDIYKNSDLYR